MIELTSSEPTLLVLHAVRLLGFAHEGRVAARFALDRGEVVESLEDFEAFGWVRRSRFSSTGGVVVADAAGYRALLDTRSRPTATTPSLLEPPRWVDTQGMTLSRRDSMMRLRPGV